MAVEEIKKVITIDTSGAVQSLNNMKNSVDEGGKSFSSLKEYKTYIDNLRASLLTLDETSKEYADVSKEIKDAQDKLNAVMKAGKESVDAAEGSYTALSKQMAELKKQWKATSDEAERNAIGEKILNINDQLKDMDASIGNYQRNVGNYASAFTGGLGKITDGVKAMNSPMKMATSATGALGKAFKALIANPVGAVIMAIVAAVKLLKTGFESNEQASNKLKKAFSALEPVTNAVKSALGWCADKVGDLILLVSQLAEGVQKSGVKIAELLNKIGLVSDEKLKSIKDNIEAGKDALSVSRELADAEIALTERKRKFTVEEAKVEAEVSELRAKAAEKDKYTLEERNKFYEEAKNKEIELFNEKMAIAEEELRIAKERAAQTVNSAADNEALAQAEANYYKVKKEYNDKMTELNKKLAATSTETKDTIVDNTKKIQEAYEKWAMSHAFEILEGEKAVKNWERALELQAMIMNSTDTVEEESVDELDPIEEMKTLNAAKLELAQEYSKQYYQILKDQENLEWMQQEVRLEIEGYTNEEIEVLRQAHNKRLESLDKESAQVTKETFTTAVASTTKTMSDLFSALADNCKEGSKEAKAFQIAAATMNMLGGVVAAVASAFNPANAWMTIYGQAAAAAAMSATVIATGVAQIAKIKSTSASGSTSASSSSSTPATQSFTPSYTTNVTGQSDIDEITNAVATGTSSGQTMQRVFVVESDITAAQNRTKVRLAESEF